MTLTNTHPVIAGEDAAMHLLASAWPGFGVLVDPFAIARTLGMHLEVVRLPADVSGKISIKPTPAPTISINSGDTHNRQRFACAHAIGHYVRTSPGQSSDFTDYRSTLAGIAVNDEEIFSNQFAAALLMPAAEISRLSKAPTSITTLAQIFGTSERAVVLRLRNLRML